MDEFEQWLENEIEVCKQQKVMVHNSVPDREYWLGAIECLELALRKYRAIQNAKAGVPSIGTRVYDTGNLLRIGEIVDIQRREGKLIRWAVVWEADKELYPNPPAYLLARREFKLSVDED